MRRAFVVSCVIFVAACGGGSSKKTSGSGSPTATTIPGASGTGVTSPATTAPNGSGGSLPAPCGLLSSSDVTAALGLAATGRDMGVTSPPGGPQQVGCTWGELASGNPVLGVQLSLPAVGIDPLKVLVAASGTSTPFNIGTNGRLLADRALIPFGGGLGKSIVWDRNGGTVVVGLTSGDQSKLEAVARAVLAKLG